MQKITPFLWYDNSAEEAANLYTSVFKNSKVLNVSRYGDAGPGPEGSVMSVTFELEGQQYIAFNGGPKFSFTPAISLFVHCETQEEVDYYWDALTEGGEPAQCGWLKDRFGLNWQIVPNKLGELLGDTDREKANRVMQAMLKMIKLDIAGLQKAYDEG